MFVFPKQVVMIGEEQPNNSSSLFIFQIRFLKRFFMTNENFFYLSSYLFSVIYVLNFLFRFKIGFSFIYIRTKLSQVGKNATLKREFLFTLVEM
jgi:hypothetical protein